MSEYPGTARVAPGKGLQLNPLAWVATRLGSRLTGTDELRIFSTLGRVRRVFPAWLAYSSLLMPFGVIPRRETELVILRVAHLRQSAYERTHHEQLGARVGLTATEIADTARPLADVAWPERTAAMLAAADEIVATRDVSDATWARAAAQCDEQELVALCLLVTQYDGLATTLHTLRVQPDRPR